MLHLLALIAKSVGLELAGDIGGRALHDAAKAAARAATGAPAGAATPAAVATQPTGPTFQQSKIEMWTYVASLGGTPDVETKLDEFYELRVNCKEIPYILPPDTECYGPLASDQMEDVLTNIYVVLTKQKKTDQLKAQFERFATMSVEQFDRSMEKFSDSILPSTWRWVYRNLGGKKAKKELEAVAKVQPWIIGGFTIIAAIIVIIFVVRMMAIFW